jgi:pectate disaccharide-lyase
MKKTSTVNAPLIVTIVAYVAACSVFAACNGGSEAAKNNDAAADARILTDATTRSDLTEKPESSPAGPDSSLPSADAPAVHADTFPTTDSVGKADGGSGGDTAPASPGADALDKNDLGADGKHDLPPGPDALANPDTTDGPAAATDGSPRADVSAPNGDTVTADRPSATPDTVTIEPRNTLYIAVDGNDSNLGTQDQPLATIKKAASLAQPGTLIYLRGGTYKFSATVTVASPAGTATDPIRLWAYPGESPVLDFAGAAITKGLSIDASYWHVRGLVVQNSAGRGLQVSTGTGIVIENCEIHHNGDMGLVVSNGASNALILNCDSHHNFDDTNGGENADGFGAKSNVGTGVIFRNCRAWANSDDGWDLYGAPSAVRFENCWAYKNGDNFKAIAGFNGDGNGFKLGKSDGDQAHHVLVNCLAWDNLGGNGYEDNNNLGGLTFYNSVSYKNKGASFEAINNTNHILKNNLAFDNGKPEDILTGSVVSNNSWQGFTVTAADFLSLDDAVAVGSRQADGSLPATTFLHLAPSSGLIDKGIDVGLPFLGAAPDLGAYEAK